MSFEYANEADCPANWIPENFGGLGCLCEVTAVATSSSTDVTASVSSAAMLKPALTVMLMLQYVTAK